LGSRLLILVLVCVLGGVGVGVVVAKRRWIDGLGHCEDARGKWPTRIWTMLSTYEESSSSAS
jgi:hypothetical protein